MFNIKEVYNELIEDIFKILVVFNFCLAIVNQITSGPLQTLLGSVLLLSFILMILFIIVKILDWYVHKFNIVKFYRNWTEVPQKYKIDKTLEYLTKNDARLEIIGRTCFQWLCGDERAFETNTESFQEKQDNLQDKIRKAIEHGSSIHFILQNPNIPVPIFEKSENDRLHKHAKAAIKSYKTIWDKLRNSDKERFTLAFSNDVIENSMLRLTENDRTTRFVFALSIQFKAYKPTKGKISKPVLVFRSDALEEYVQEFNYMSDKAIHKEKFDKEREKGHEEVESLIKEYSHYSPIRKDESSSLATIAASYFLAENDSRFEGVPPVCIQLLVTNECTTQCKMCDHFELFKGAEHELTKDELCNTLDYINALGTNSIIISGGEPLARKDIFVILTYGKTIGLNIGLLTNGVMKGDRSLNYNEAETISQTCSWVQLSIDSFNKETYEKIRGGDYMNIALESLTNIVNAGLKDVEVCFTIQKDNFKEIANISEGIDNLTRTDEFPPSVPVRFKFAHGPNERGFLCSQSDLEEVIGNLLKLNEDPRFNSAYHMSIIQDGYFDLKEGIPKGIPLKYKMRDYKSLGYTCHALRLTCMINSNGDVYPCCFLFDDNNANSEFRNLYRIGSLRSEETNRVMKPDSNENPLAKIWYESEKLKYYRRDILPVDQEACYYCTRYFYQNEYLNKLYDVFNRYRYHGIAKEFANNGNSINFWL